MKNITLLLVLLLLLFAGATGIAYSLYKNEKAARQIAESNVDALRQDTTKKAAIIQVDRNQFTKLFREKAEQVEALGYKLKNVKEAHFVRYVFSHDTIALTDTVLQQLRDIHAPQSDYLNTFEWNFNHGCFQHVVTYTEGDHIATDTLFGAIEITRLVVKEKPRWRIFKPRYWNKNNWPTSVAVENNCGFEIKENTVIEIK